MDLDAGDDEHADKESHSPSKKAKGKPGRKPGQTTKAAASKDHDQEVDQDHGKDPIEASFSTRPSMLR